MSKRSSPTWFSWGLMLVLLAAVAHPELGSQSGPLPTQALVHTGIALVFFLHGTRLELGALASGSRAWKSHLIAQGTGFVLLPLCGLLAWQLPDFVLSAPLRLGVLYLCALPTTVSSAVVLTRVARGSASTAIFNATLSSVCAVVVTPLWVGAAARMTEPATEILDVVGRLVALLLVPLGVGMLCRVVVLRFRTEGATSGRERRLLAPLGALDQVVVLFIVYTVFCDAFVADLFAEFSVLDAAALLFVCCALLGIALAWTRVLGRAMGLEAPERIAATFIGATKSLAVGVPMAAALFEHEAPLGTILLPAMVYHPLQLLVGGMLAERWRRDAER